MTSKKTCALEKNLCARKGMSLVAKEWEVVKGHPNLLGKGDLVFRQQVDEQIAYFVVEVKHLKTGSGNTAKVSRRKARRKVEEQALRYSEVLKLGRYSKHWNKVFVASKDVPVFACIFTNDLFRIVNKF